MPVFPITFSSTLSSVFYFEIYRMFWLPHFNHNHHSVVTVSLTRISSKVTTGEILSTFIITTNAKVSLLQQHIVQSYEKISTRNTTFHHEKHFSHSIHLPHFSYSLSLKCACSHTTTYLHINLTTWFCMDYFVHRLIHNINLH